jgi:hypothetical protein
MAICQAHKPSETHLESVTEKGDRSLDKLVVLSRERKQGAGQFDKESLGCAQNFAGVLCTLAEEASLNYCSFAYSDLGARGALDFSGEATGSARIGFEGGMDHIRESPALLLVQELLRDIVRRRRTTRQPWSLRKKC